MSVSSRATFTSKVSEAGLGEEEAAARLSRQKFFQYLHAGDSKEAHNWARQQPGYKSRKLDLGMGALGVAAGAGTGVLAMLDDVDSPPIPPRAAALMLGAGGLAGGAFLGVLGAVKKNKARRMAIIKDAVETGTLPSFPSE